MLGFWLVHVGNGGREVRTPDESAIALNAGRRRVNLSSSPVRGTCSYLIFAHVEEKVGADQNEDRHAEDLESETCNHDVDAPQGGLLCGCVISHTTSNGL